VDDYLVFLFTPYPAAGNRLVGLRGRTGALEVKLSSWSARPILY